MEGARRGGRGGKRVALNRAGKEGGGRGKGKGRCEVAGAVRQRDICVIWLYVSLVLNNNIKRLTSSAWYSQGINKEA